MIEVANVMDRRVSGQFYSREHHIQGQNPLDGLQLPDVPQPFVLLGVGPQVMACPVSRYETGPLERRQQRVFDPLLAWVRQELGWELHTSSSIYGTTQSDTAVAAVQQYLEGKHCIPSSVGNGAFLDLYCCVGCWDRES